MRGSDVTATVLALPFEGRWLAQNSPARRVSEVLKLSEPVGAGLPNSLPSAMASRPEKIIQTG